MIVGAKGYAVEDKQRGEEARPASEVLRAKRLEIVDDEGKVRASLGTLENGVGELALRDASGRVRAVLEVGEIPGEASGLRVFDTNGRARVGLFAYNDPRKGAVVQVNDEKETARATLALDEGGQALLGVGAGEKNRKITAVVGPDGAARLTFTGEGPMIGLGSFDEDRASPTLILTDEKGNGGMVLDGGRYKPYVRFRDPAGKVRAGLELTPGGQLDVTSFGDGEGAASNDKRYHGFLPAFSICLLVIGGAFVGAWATGRLSGDGVSTQAGPGLLFLGACAVLTSLVIAGLVALLDYLRR